MLEVLKAAYDSEINIHLSTFWDGGWEIKIGDEMNGFIAEDSFRDIEQVAPWLKKQIIILYPSSDAAKLFSQEVSHA